MFDAIAKYEQSRYAKQNSIQDAHVAIKASILPVFLLGQHEPNAVEIQARGYTRFSTLQSLTLHLE